MAPGPSQQTERVPSTSLSTSSASTSRTSQTAVTKRQKDRDDLALMPPPPPLKRIKRPAQVLDEDEYTAALSEIIARDYFPGLLESQAQHEYLAALDSGNESWIAEAAHKLRHAGAPQQSQKSVRNTGFDRRSTTSTPRRDVADTPVGDCAGGETPVLVHRNSLEQQLQDETTKQRIDTTGLSLGTFQAKYTSEDNESFNALLDKQNQKRREKHAYLWTQDQRIPSGRLIAYHQAREARLLKERGEDGSLSEQQEQEQEHEQQPESNAVTASTSTDIAVVNNKTSQDNDDKTKGKAMALPSTMMTTGATDSRPARPDAWHITRPDNALMFPATSIDEDAPQLQTVAEHKEQLSKMGPKQVVHANTRFPPMLYVDDEDPKFPPQSPSLNTEIIARRDDARRSAARKDKDMDADTGTGAETPRVNGYAFVDEDEPENISQNDKTDSNLPSYRDLLAGQFDATPNPFKIGDIRKREELHLRMVEKQAKMKRDKERDRLKDSDSHTPPHRLRAWTPRSAILTPGGGASASASASSSANMGNMTPAARRLMEKLGGSQTPLRTGTGPSSAIIGKDGGRDASSARDMWTPVRTPRRKR
ncbi:hypothetical protein ABEF95_004438 [Exophiala dermatitidis]